MAQLSGPARRDGDIVWSDNTVPHIDDFRGCFLIFIVVSSAPEAYSFWYTVEWERDLLLP